MVLLDPTYRDGYADALQETIRFCRNSGAAVLLLTWGMRSWGLAGVFECDAVTEWTARITNSGNTYEMVMAGFGDTRLAEIAANAASGW